MTNCCSLTNCDGTPPKKGRCPVNGRDYAEVSSRTIPHHIRLAWEWRATAQRYFFCEDPFCSVAYFGDDGSVIPTNRLRTPDVKATADDAMLCHCFGIRHADARNNPSIRDFVMAQIRQGHCSCDTANPSGRCCLKNFPKVGADGTE